MEVAVAVTRKGELTSRTGMEFVIERREVYRHLSNAVGCMAHADEALRDIGIKYG